MRTVTLDDDVAAMLKKEVERRKATFKEVLNDALRNGLLPKKPAPRRRYKTPLYDTGPAKFPVDNVAEALAFAEGEDFK